MKNLKIVAISASLRKVSYNTVALEALKQMAPEYAEIIIGDIDNLPLFNPERKGEFISAVEQLKSSLAGASGYSIASSEYAHGKCGPMKNSPDWLVSGVEFPNKSFMLINTSLRACNNVEYLREVLKTMSGVVIDSTCSSVPLLSSRLYKNGTVANREISAMLNASLIEFCRDINA
jgi:chromate reductase, NAD(P)H dehydrogenase (quinone)